MAGSDGGANNLVQDFEESFQVGGRLICPPQGLEGVERGRGKQSRAELWGIVPGRGTSYLSTSGVGKAWSEAGLTIFKNT